jgi:hypothetical protein
MPKGIESMRSSEIEAAIAAGVSLVTPTRTYARMFDESPAFADGCWKAARRFMLQAHFARVQLREWVRGISENEDLTADAKARLTRDCREKASAGLKGHADAFRSALDAFETKLAADCDVRLAKLFERPVPGNADDGSRAAAERSEALVKLLARQEIDRIVDRAKSGEDTAGLELGQVYSELVAAGETAVAATFETHGLARVRREFPEHVAKDFEKQVRAGQIARLPEHLRDLREHQAALRGAVVPCIDAVLGDAGGATFDEVSVGLDAAVMVLGAEIAGD